MKILLVDDTATDRLILRSYLDELGHEVEEAHDGAEALQRHAEFLPDLLLLDVEMPRLNGYDTARRLRSEHPDWVPIIFLSARATPNDIARGIDAGGDDYLMKPIDPIVLSAKMRAMQRIADMRQQLLQTSQALASANAQLEQLAHLDGLTGLANRRYLDEWLPQALEEARRSNGAVSVLMTDVDHFKCYNDHYGHLTGDSCLKQVARCLNRSFPEAESLTARYGGEEFCVVLPGADGPEAAARAEQLRALVESRQIPHAPCAGAAVVTMSIGMATADTQHPLDAKALLRKADQALYRAKQGGRNQACF